MNKIFLIIIFFLISCSPKTLKNDIIFTDQMSFEDFKVKLEAYAKNNPYPNIDN
jgi:hypothetical protein|tara:strand:+ start:235 stop:396 length:162 start_codon:yes stop_codon:yes gene_type:complete